MTKKTIQHSSAHEYPNSRNSYNKKVKNTREIAGHTGEYRPKEVSIFVAYLGSCRLTKVMTANLDPLTINTSIVLRTIYSILY